MRSFAIWVTTNCNMACTYCYEGNNKLNSNVSDEVLERMLSFIREYMLLYPEEEIIVDFHGGEPLLQFDKIRYAVEELQKTFKDRVRFGITTNGTIISEEILKFLTENFRYSLSISLDGDRQTHNLNRKLKSGEESYQIVIKNAKKFLAKREDVRVRMTVNPKTVNTLCESVNSLIDNGFQTIAPAIDYFDSEWDRENMKVLEEQMIFLKEKLELRKEPVNIGLVDNYRNTAVGKCSGGTNSFHMSPDGYIYPCAFVVGSKEYIVGNVFSGLDNKRIEEFQNMNEPANCNCKGCSHEAACVSSRCKLVNKIITGDYYSPAPSVCMVENIKYKISQM